MSRWWVLALRLVVVGLLIVVAAWGSLWAHFRYETHCARLMFEETSRVRVGDDEASVLPLVRRYSGFKWTPAPLPPEEDWLDKDEYEYQKKRVSDYKYELGLSPFGTTDRQTSRFTQVVRAIRTAFPAQLRPLLGM